MRKLALALSGFLLALLLCEGLLRIWGNVPEVKSIAIDMTARVVAGDAPAPGVETVSDPVIRWVPTDGPYHAGSGSIRVAVLGDSIAYGWCVGRQGWPTQLGEPYEVWNYAVSGYDALQEVAYFEQARKVYPDIIIWNWCPNDVEMAAFHEFETADWTAPHASRQGQWWLERSDLLRLAWINYQLYRHPPHHPGWPAAEAAMDRLRALYPTTRVLFVAMPYRAPGQYDNARAMALAAAHGFQVMDATPIISPDDPSLWCDSIHPSAAGHARLAEAIRGKLYGVGVPVGAGEGPNVPGVDWPTRTRRFLTR